MIVAALALMLADEVGKSGMARMLPGGAACFSRLAKCGTGDNRATPSTTYPNAPSTKPMRSLVKMYKLVESVTIQRPSSGFQRLVKMDQADTEDDN